MHADNHNFFNYFKSILTWGLPGLYVIVALYFLKFLLAGIRVH